MRIAVSGHQSRPGIDWEWTASEIRKLLQREVPIERAFTSLARGSDQVFAQQALGLGIPVTAVIPMPHYDRLFEGNDLAGYEFILSRCDVVELPGESDDEHSFLVAGQYVVDNADLLLAIWDGKSAAGVGGTADIVRYCAERGRPVIYINPITKAVHTLG